MAFCRVCEIIGQLKFFVGFNRRNLVKLARKIYENFNLRKYQRAKIITDKLCRMFTVQSL